MNDLTLYTNLLQEIKQRIHTAQARSLLAVNAELLNLYWEIGRLLDQRQQQEGWGAGIIPKLAVDLHNELPEMKGFSERNLKRMLAFYRAYPAVNPKVPQTVAQLHNIVDFLAQRPILSAQDICTQFNVSHQTAMRAIQRLIEMDILDRIDERKRNQHFLARRIVDIFQR